MVEVFIPPPPGPGAEALRIVDDVDARQLVGAFAHASPQPGEVFMLLLGPGRELIAVVAFGEVPLAEIVADPRPLVAIAAGGGSHGVVLGQVGVRPEQVVAARRTLGAALAVDDVELLSWVDLATASG